MVWRFASSWRGRNSGGARGIHVVASGNTHSETWDCCCLLFGLRLFLRSYFGRCSSLVWGRSSYLLRGCFCLPTLWLVPLSHFSANLGEILFRWLGSEQDTRYASHGVIFSFVALWLVGDTVSLVMALAGAYDGSIAAVSAMSVRDTALLSTRLRLIGDCYLQDGE